MSYEFIKDLSKRYLELAGDLVENGLDPLAAVANVIVAPINPFETVDDAMSRLGHEFKTHGVVFGEESLFNSVMKLTTESTSAVKARQEAQLLQRDLVENIPAYSDAYKTYLADKQSLTPKNVSAWLENFNSLEEVDTLLEKTFNGSIGGAGYISMTDIVADQLGIDKTMPLSDLPVNKQIALQQALTDALRMNNEKTLEAFKEHYEPKLEAAKAAKAVASITENTQDELVNRLVESSTFPLEELDEYFAAVGMEDLVDDIVDELDIELTSTFGDLSKPQIKKAAAMIAEQKAELEKLVEKVAADVSVESATAGKSI